MTVQRAQRFSVQVDLKCRARKKRDAGRSEDRAIKIQSIAVIMAKSDSLKSVNTANAMRLASPAIMIVSAIAARYTTKMALRHHKGTPDFTGNIAKAATKITSVTGKRPLPTKPKSGKGSNPDAKATDPKPQINNTSGIFMIGLLARNVPGMQVARLT
jgi:hypothetical protein